MAEFIDYAVTNKVGTITINRPQARNAMASRELMGIKMKWLTLRMLVVTLAVLPASLLVANSSWATAESSPTTESSAPKETKKKTGNKRVCKKVKPTGSHIASRVCLKKKEWDAMAKAAQENLRKSTVGDTGSVSQ